MSQHPPPVQLTAADELAHPPGEERLWGESWYFDFTDRDGTLGGYVRLASTRTSVSPGTGRASWARADPS